MRGVIKLICLCAAAAFVLSAADTTVGQEVTGDIDWQEGKEIELDKKSRKDSTIFQDFDVLSGKKKKEPIMIYFYYPEPAEGEKKPKKSELKMIKYCEMMEKELFGDNSFKEIADEFICVKVNFKTFHKDLKKKYKVKYAPYILIFDCLGEKVGKIDNPKQDMIQLLIAMREIISNSNDKRASDK